MSGHKINNANINITQTCELTTTNSDNFIIIEPQKRTAQKQKIIIELISNETKYLTFSLAPDIYTNYKFFGSDDPNDIRAGAFFVDKTKELTAQNIVATLKKNSFFNDNFNIKSEIIEANNRLAKDSLVALPGYAEEKGIEWNNAYINKSVLLSSKITIEAKQVGSEHNILLHGRDTMGVKLEIFNGGIYDSISGTNTASKIKIQYFDCDIRLLGDTNANVRHLGILIGESIKTYIGEPLWFNLSGISKSLIPSTNFALGWKYYNNLAAIRLLIFNNNIPIYITNAIGVLKSTLNKCLDNYLYVDSNNSKVKILSNKPITTYIAGQKVFLSFICKTSLVSIITNDAPLYINIKALDRNKKTLRNEVDLNSAIQPKSVTTPLNTFTTTLDKYIDHRTHTIELRLCQYINGNIIEKSDPQTYKVKNHCLTTNNLTAFIFLNSFGVFESINLGGGIETKTTRTFDLFTKTSTPIQPNTENINKAKTEIEYIITSDPIDNTVIEWMRELSDSTNVYLNDGTPINITEMQLTRSITEQRLQTVTVKYKLIDNE